ncbi:phosphatidylinositol 3-kinase 2-like [Folsomia candida]|uniref:Uncharacterized protein n=1 Tax=Folsomia candida TaxID=158441 RepID=A0A226ETK3_FOLCA|nr:phosphatidylinositol 3-kinase 2-like [Folsomia candida]XP_035703302.1 phosphatidylinositol 3-kinase 2-like [Folsomia candida]OXA59936.1 hypothetical protein Fcan01_05175 [Folsomia candida]
MTLINPNNVIICTATFVILCLNLTGGNALEFPRKINQKGYGFPLKRNAPSDDAFAESFEDLVPLAQSYFITPETPSTTTIKPTFKRRSTLQPITSWGGDRQNKNKKKGYTIPSEVDTSTNNYNPFSQIVDTGFQPKKSYGNGANKKRRPSSIDMMRRDQNVNEGGVPSINIESSTANYEKETGNAKDNKKTIGRRKPKKVIDYAGGPSFAVNNNKNNNDNNKISSPRPQRFVGQRRTYQAKVKNVENAPATSSETPVAFTSPNPSRGSFSRSGRQYGRQQIRTTEKLYPVEIQPQYETTDSKPLLRRKKFTTTTATSTNDGDNANNVDKIRPRQSPNLNDADLQRINSNVFASRKPFALGRGSTTFINPVDNAQAQQDSAPLNRRMRHRPGTPIAQKTLLTPLVPDSEHESSSDAITVFADSDDSPNISSNATSLSSDSLPPVSRNLSNRKPNALDRLSNRQASAQRFLTPKKNTEASLIASPPTTKAPAIQSKTPRKSPLSLANLRNRRLGGSSSTTTSTEAPIVSQVDPESHEVLGNLDALEGTVVVENNQTAQNGTEADSPKETAEVQEEEPNKSPLSGLLRNRRPPLRRPLPGAKPGHENSPVIQIKPRGPNLKPRTTEATTPKPINIETTTPPSCEDGKRYNKILRKCIPAFKSG